MALLSVNNSECGPDRWSRTNNTGSWYGVADPAYQSASIGFFYDMPDYDMLVVSSSYSFRGTFFEAVVPDYEIDDETISGSIDIYSISSFVVSKTSFSSMSRNDDMNAMTSQFIAMSSDYVALTASYDPRETFVLGTTADVDAHDPEFPNPPPVGNHDLNRFRKVYTHVRVRPRIRKFSSSP